ncbi:MAG: DUF4136 domain-containing protein [Polyangiales bacterium]
MLHSRIWLFTAALCSLSPLACGSATRTGEINVEFDEDADFSQFETFTVLTPELVPDAEELGVDAKLFNEAVNTLIIDAMTAPPVCLTFIPPERVTDSNQPDLFAGNGLSRTTDQGTVWRCVGGWWWGTWGWFWDPCLWRTPVTVEFDVGSLYLPVGPRPAAGEDAKPIFNGTARKLLDTGTSIDDKVRTAVREIFQRWPERRTCTP